MKHYICTPLFILFSLSAYSQIVWQSEGFFSDEGTIYFHEFKRTSDTEFIINKRINSPKGEISSSSYYEVEIDRSQKDSYGGTYYLLHSYNARGDRVREYSFNYMPDKNTMFYFILDPLEDNKLLKHYVYEDIDSFDELLQRLYPIHLTAFLRYTGRLSDGDIRKMKTYGAWGKG